MIREIEYYKLIIFDADGTWVTTRSGATFRKEASDWQWLPGRIEKIKALREAGIHIAVATNQGGVSFGYMKQEDILAELTKMIKEAGIAPGGLYICYTHPKASLEQYRIEDDRRKPGPGMLLEAMDHFGVSPEHTLMVGDRPEDEKSAQAAGTSFVWAWQYFGDENHA